MKNEKGRKKGFTLVELLVVIAILAILASVSVVGYLSFTKKANLAADKEEANQATRALQSYLVLNPNTDLNNSNEVTNAVLAATDNAYDISNIELRSKGYSLWFNTKTREIEVLDKIDSAAKVKNARRENIYNTLDAFLWTENTPYLYLSQKGNDFAELLTSLNNGSYGFTDIDTLKNDLNNSSKEYFNYFDNSVLFIDDNLDENFSLVGYKLGETSTKELYANGINSISGIKDENVLNTYNIPSHITEIKTGAFSNQNNVNLKIYSENINLIGNNPVTSNSTIEFINETKKEISEILSYSKEEINIKANNKNLKLLGVDLKDQDGQKIAEVKLDESSYGNVINIGEKFTLLNQKVVDNNFDVLKEDIQNEIISVNDNFNNLLAWEKEFYINPDTNLGDKYNNYYSEYQKFYNQTDKLTEQTGTYTRYLMYKDSSLRLIQTFKNISINYDSTSKSLDLLEKLNINNINNNLPFEVVSTYNNSTTVPFNYLFNVSSTGTAFALNDNISILL